MNTTLGNRWRTQLRVLVTATTAAALALGVTACGSSGSSDSSSQGSGSTVGAPPTPACQASADFGCWRPAAPEPGTDVPPVSVKYALRPAADNSMLVIAMQKGWFKDAGITISPPPYGLKATFDNATPFVLNGTADMAAMDSNTILGSLRTQKKLKMAIFTDSFYGMYILANPKLHLKTFDEYRAEGMQPKEALQAALKPLIDSKEKLTTSPLIQTRPFINMAFQIAGDKVPALNLLDDPQALIAARSGQADFLTPTNAQSAVTLLSEGWTPVLHDKDLVSSFGNDPTYGSKLAKLTALIGIGANSDYISKNQNTVLRFASVVYRTIAAVLADKGEGGLLDAAVPFINSYTAGDLTAKSLYETYTSVDPFIPFDEQGKRLVTDPSSGENYQNTSAGYIKSLQDTQALPAGIVPDDGMWGGQVWQTLKWYRDQAEPLLAKLAANPPTGTAADLATKARQYFDWYDYLDAYRLAKAASETK
ncbi:hypothetical protein [Streptomyces sp. NPDC002346]